MAETVYEVNLELAVADGESADETAHEFDGWLAAHVDAMLALPGFVSAETLRIDTESEAGIQRTVQYRLTDRAALDRYLEEHAATMRRDGTERYGERLRATRRVLDRFGDGGGPRCLNCESPLTGQYCDRCGQRAETRIISLWQLLRDAVGDLFELDSRLWRTLGVLVFRPGKLTAEYLRGRRARYMPPFRMYLVLSLMFFLLVASVDRITVTTADELADGAAEAGAPIDSDTDDDEPGTIDLGDALRVSFNKDEAKSCDVTVGPPLDELTSAEFIRERCETLRAGGLRQLLAEVFRHLPTAMFLFLPVVALLLKLLYPFSRRFYVEHLLYVLHVQSFIFLTYIVLFLLNRVLTRIPLGDIVDGLVGLAATFYVPYYLYRSLRIVYGQGRTATLLKYVMLLIGYLVATLIMLLATLVFSALTV